MNDEHETIHALKQENQQLRTQVAELEQANDELRHTNLMLEEQLSAYVRQHIRDPLTGLFNRQYLHEALERELNRSSRRNRPIGLVMVGVERLKHLRDTYGEDVESTLLRALSMFLQTHTRREDTICRYGTKEFTVMLVESPMESTQKRAKELCSAIKHLKVQHKDHLFQNITLSMGIACFPNHGDTTEKVIQAATLALANARSLGEDDVHIAEPPKEGS
jgi:diguanylate cyclase (GGDEF)-like protein